MSASEKYDAEIARIKGEIRNIERNLAALEKRMAVLERDVEVIRNGVRGILDYLSAISNEIKTQLEISTRNLDTTKKLNRNLEEFRKKDFPSYQRNLLVALAVMDTTIIGAIIGAEKLREKARMEALKRFGDYLEKEVHYAEEAYRQQMENIMRDYINFINDMFTQFIKMVQGELELFEKLTLALNNVQEFYSILEPERIDTEVYKLALEVDFARRMAVFNDVSDILQDITGKISEASISSRKIVEELEGKSIEIEGLDEDTLLYLPLVLLEVDVGGEKHTVLVGPRLEPGKPASLEKALLERLEDALLEKARDLSPEEKARIARRIASKLRDPAEKKVLLKALAG